ncbi:putative antirestriction protein [Escherichia coli]|nr:putative antirestriction protein [Escherichia coli]
MPKRLYTRWAKQMMPEYEGGFWHFIRLPDGGGYMMPDGDRFHMVNGANWFDRTVSADAAGIILTSLVINRQLWLYHDSGDAGPDPSFTGCAMRSCGVTSNFTLNATRFTRLWTD